MAHRQRIGLGVDVGTALEFARLLLGVQRLAQRIRRLIEVSGREVGGEGIHRAEREGVPLAGGDEAMHVVFAVAGFARVFLEGDAGKSEARAQIGTQGQTILPTVVGSLDAVVTGQRVEELLGDQTVHPAQQMYRKPEQVVMFSGGLDSLAGAIDEVVNQKRRVLLVTHKATSKLNKRYQTLEQMLAEKADGNAPPRISVRVHKTKELNHEYTQRSRSFLYVSIGATIAKMLGLNSVRFYENGVISLNLPVCAQVVGGRATRTTHPRVMKGFQDIVSLVAEGPFTVENPYIWKTKADVVKVITDAGCQDLIKHSMTCTHTWEMTNQHTHCGGCSQCIDRRFAVLAANADQHDPVDHYKFDVFTQSRDAQDKKKNVEKIMAAAYLERANQVKNLADVTQFVSS